MLGLDIDVHILIPSRRVIYELSVGAPIAPLLHRTIAVYDGILARHLEHRLGRGYSLALSPDGGRIAAGCHALVYLWDVNTGQMVLDPLEGHVLPVSCVAFSPDDHRVLFAVVVDKAHPERPETSIPVYSEHGDRLWLMLKSCWEFEMEMRLSAAAVYEIMKEVTQNGLRSGDVEMDDIV